MATPTGLILNAPQQDELVAISQSRSLPAGYVFRAKLILMLAEGASFRTIKHKLGTTAPTIVRWKERFLSGGIDDAEHVSSRPTAERFDARLACPDSGRHPGKASRWIDPLELPQTHSPSGRQQDVVHRVWKEAGLKPHRIERYLPSHDPDFESKAADIIGLYLNPPQQAAVFCVDEKTAIQALDRLDPVLPLSPGRADRHGFEYCRHGTLPLYAALDTQSGTQKSGGSRFSGYAESLPASRIWPASFAAISTPTQQTLNRSSGDIPIRPAASAVMLSLPLAALKLSLSCIT